MSTQELITLLELHEKIFANNHWWRLPPLADKGFIEMVRGKAILTDKGMQVVNAAKEAAEREL